MGQVWKSFMSIALIIWITAQIQRYAWLHLQAASNTTECNQNNTLAEETFECYQEEVNKENGITNLLRGKWIVLGSLLIIFLVFFE